MNANNCPINAIKCFIILILNRMAIGQRIDRVAEGGRQIWVCGVPEPQPDPQLELVAVRCMSKVVASLAGWLVNAPILVMNQPMMP